LTSKNYIKFIVILTQMRKSDKLKCHIIPVYMIKTKVTILEGRLLSGQSEQSEKLSKSSDWLEKAGPPKKHFGFDHVNRLINSFILYRRSRKQPNLLKRFLDHK